MTKFFTPKSPPTVPDDIPLDDWSVLMAYPTKAGNMVIVDTPEGTDSPITYIDDLYHIVKTHKVHFTYLPPSLFSALLQGLGHPKVKELVEDRFIHYGYYAETFQDRYSIRYSADRITLRRLQAGKGSFYIQNLWGRVNENEVNWNENFPTLEELREEVKVLLDFHKEWGIPLAISPAAASRYFLQDMCGREEMMWSRRYNPDFLAQFVYSCHAASRQEVTLIGTVEESVSFDKPMAHLEYMAGCPSLVGSTVSKGRKPYYIPSTDYGTYDGEAYIPAELFELGPLPVILDIRDPRLNLFAPSTIRIVYPTGAWYPFKNLSKPRVDLLLKLSSYGVKVKFTDSIQVFCREPKVYPYEFYLAIYKVLQKLAHKSIFLKNLYVNIIGAMIAVFPDLDNNQLVTLAIFNPLVAARVYGELACETFYRSFKFPYGSRIGLYADTLIIEGREVDVGGNYRPIHEGNSPLTIVHPGRKGYPDDGGTLRELLYKQRDRYTLTQKGERIIGLRRFLYTGKPPGKLESYTIRDKPNYGRREPVDDKKLRLGELMENKFYCNPYTGIDGLMGSRGGDV